MRKKIILLLATVIMYTTAVAQMKVGQQIGSQKGNGPRGGMMMNSKSQDSVLIALKAETLGKFRQFTYEDKGTGKQLTYNLCFPKDYDISKTYPMLMFIGDATTIGDPQRPLSQGYGALEFATDSDQLRHPSFVLVPSFSAVCVDDDFNTTEEVEITVRLIQHLCQQYPIDQKRLYTTGQSMGGMMSFYFNVAHSDLFAASLLVSSQWDTSKMAHFANKRFFYIVAGGDDKASKGQHDLMQVLSKEGALMDYATWSARLPEDEQNRKVNTMLQLGNPIHFVSFTPGTVLPENGHGMEHMASFDFAYKIQAVRDWLFKQSKE
jgi:predicted peptidase